MDKIAQDRLTLHSQMKGGRSTWEVHWQEVCEIMDPLQADFYGEKPEPGQKRMSKIFDATCALALERFAAIMQSILTPPGQVWHKLKPKGGEVEAGSPVARWFDAVNDKLYDLRYSPKANFDSQQHQNYRGLGSVGTAALYIDSAPGIPLRYRSVHMSEIYLGATSAGQVDIVHREFGIPARNVLQDYSRPDDYVCEAVKRMAQNTPLADVPLLHCVFPNPDAKPGSMNPKMLPWASLTICMLDGSIIRRGGYRTFPYAISRYTLATKEIYGRSPGMMALPDGKMLQEMAKHRYRQAQFELDPTWLTSDDGALAAFRAVPGAIISGGLDESLNPRVRPLDRGSNFAVDAAVTDQVRSVVNDFFLVTLFQILVDNPGQMTAYEVMQRAQEKGALMAPVMGRQQSENLGPTLEREFELAWFGGHLPPMPPEMEQVGGEYDIEYQSPLATAARAEKSLSIQRTVAQVTPLAQLKPEVLDIFDFDDMAKTIAQSNSLDNTSINSAEIVEALREQRAQQQALMAAAQNAPGVAGAVKDIASVAA